MAASCTIDEPVLIVQEGKGAQMRRGKMKITKIVEPMGWKAIGNKLIDYNKTIEMEWEEKKEESPQQELFD